MSGISLMLDGEVSFQAASPDDGSDQRMLQFADLERGYAVTVFVQGEVLAALRQAVSAVQVATVIPADLAPNRAARRAATRR